MGPCRRHRELSPAKRAGQMRHGNTWLRTAIRGPGKCRAGGRRPLEREHLHYRVCDPHQANEPAAPVDPARFGPAPAARPGDQPDEQDTPTDLFTAVIYGHEPVDTFFKEALPRER